MAKITIFLVILCIAAATSRSSRRTTTESPGVLEEEQGTDVTIGPADGTTVTEVPTEGNCTVGYEGNSRRRRKWRTQAKNMTDSDELETPEVTSLVVAVVNDGEEEVTHATTRCRWRKRKYRRRHQEVGGEDEEEDCGRGRRRKWRNRGNGTELADEENNEEVGEKEPVGGIVVVENTATGENIGILVVVEEVASTNKGRKRFRCSSRGRNSRRNSKKRRKSRRKWARRKLTTPPPSSEEYEDISEPVDVDDADVEVVEEDDGDGDVEEIEENSVDLASVLPV